MTERLIIDVETDGLLPHPAQKEPMTRMHCIAMMQVGGGFVDLYYDGCTFEALPKAGSVREGIQRVKHASLLVGHNILGYDLDVIRFVDPSFGYIGDVIDTQVLGRLVMPSIGYSDYRRTKDGFPAQLIGRHSLKAWGWRIGEHKGVYSPAVDAKDKWKVFTQDMGEYCMRDVEVCGALYDRLRPQVTDLSCQIEHEFAKCMIRQMKNGVGFDVESALKLVGVMQVDQAEVAERLHEALGQRTTTKTWVTPKRKEKKSKTTVEPYNLNSRQQVVGVLKVKYGWEPKLFTKDGLPKLDDAVLADLSEDTIPILPDLRRYFMLTKRLGQLVDGKHAWLDMEHGGRIYGYVNHNGARTGRCTHSRPNVAQVPARGEYAKECRSLFIPRPGWVMTGADLSGVDLRVLAHYLHPYDGGAFVKLILEGDVHTHNQDACGYANRQTAKNTIYSVVYGAKGKRVAKVATDGEGRHYSDREGAQIRQRLLDGIPGLEQLIHDMEEKFVERGFLWGLDGRKLRAKRKGSACNTAVQGGAALVMKVATMARDRRLDTFLPEGSWAPMVHCHDEYQCEHEPKEDILVRDISVWAMTKAGQELNLKIRIEGEAKTGKNWSETH